MGIKIKSRAKSEKLCFVLFMSTVVKDSVRFVCFNRKIFRMNEIPEFVCTAAVNVAVSVKLFCKSY